MLERLGAEAKIIAGGQSLVPLMNMRLLRPSHLIDVNGLAELRFQREDDQGVTLGALTRHRTIERSPDVARFAPLLAEAAPFIGDREVRLRGTLGGSLVHADPAAEFPTVATALEADVVLASKRGQRVVAADQFFLEANRTATQPDELLLEVRLGHQPPETGTAFVEFSRQQGSFAIVSAAAALTLRGGEVQSARLSLGGVHPTPFRPRETEAWLVGAALSEALLKEAATRAAAETRPLSDMHASAGYRQHVAAELLSTALARAAERARRSSLEPV